MLPRRHSRVAGIARGAADPPIHEITSIYLHAAALPRRSAPPRGDPDADTFPYSQSQTCAAPQTHRPGKTVAERVAHSLGKTGANSQTQSLRVALIYAGFVSLACRLFLSRVFQNPETLPDQSPART